MQIPAETLAKWKQLQAHGDIAKMANGSRNKQVYLSNAINQGKCSEEIFITLRDFYAKRELLIASAKPAVCLQPN